MASQLRLLLLFILSSFVLTPKGFAQSTAISSIKFEGVIKNDEGYLYQFLKSQVGEPLDEKKLREDVFQLCNRTGIANALPQIDTLKDGSINLTYQIDEQMTLLPVVGVGGIQGNVWWQVGLQEHNLFGKEQSIAATYLHSDGRPGFNIFYQNNRIKNSPWGLGGGISRFASVEPLYFEDASVNYKYTNTGLSGVAVRNFGFNQRLSFGSTIFREDYQKNNLADFEVTQGPDELTLTKLLLKARYDFNKIKPVFHQFSGYRFSLQSQAVRTLTDGSQFVSASFEGVKYWRPTKTVNVALKVGLGVASNENSPFAPYVLDSKINVRGVGNRVERGTAQLIINTELRETFFQNDSWAVQVVLFMDAGSLRAPGGRLKELIDTNNFQHFTGLGMRFINTKIFQATFRIDYGLDVWNVSERGLVFGIGQYF